MVALIVGQRCPIKADDGLRINAAPPLLVLIGVPRPTQDEIVAINRGQIIHRFGENKFTAWLTMHFFIDNKLIYFGEVFHSAGKSTTEYTDEKLAALRNALQPDKGIACTLALVNTEDQLIVSLRAYAWSNRLSLAFVNAAERTRHVAPKDADQAANNLMRHSVHRLALLGDVTFTLDGL